MQKWIIDPRKDCFDYAKMQEMCQRIEIAAGIEKLRDEVSHKYAEKNE